MENYIMKILSGIFLFASLVCPVSAAVYVTIIEGLAGTPQYQKLFSEQTTKLRVAAESVTAKDHVSVLSEKQATREKILAHFEQLRSTTTKQDRIAVFMIGHGSFDGYEYKFNIPGPDITDQDISDFMDALPADIQLLVNTSSASGALIDLLKKESRVLITATKNGNERLATRFGAFFFDALSDSSADINKNNSITAQEAFDFAARKVTDYFETQGQLATEHSAISGTHAAQFVVARMGINRPQAEDPEITSLMQQRSALDIKIEDLQLRKTDMQPDEFLNQLQQLMIDLSIVQDKIDQLSGAEEQ